MCNSVYAIRAEKRQQYRTDSGTFALQASEGHRGRKDGSGWSTSTSFRANRYIFALCLGAVTLYRCVQHREDEHIFDAFSHSHVHLSMLAHAASRDSVLPPSFWHPTGHLEKMRLRGGEDEEAEEKDEKDEEELREGETEVEEGRGGCRQRFRGQVRTLLLKTMSSTLSSLHGI